MTQPQEGSTETLAAGGAEPTSEATSDALRWPDVGGSWNGFSLLRELGRSETTRVYVASDAALGNRQVVVKLLDRPNQGTDLQGRFEHANLAPIYSVHTDPASGLTGICMPFLGGNTMVDLFCERGGDSREIVDIILSRAGLTHSAEHPGAKGRDYVDAIVSVGVDLCQGLEILEKNDLIHGNLKPSNILIAEDGRAVLLDLLGNGRVPDEERHATAYEAPEISGASRTDHTAPDIRSDLFSMGAILYEALTGRLPYGEPDNRAAPDRNGQYSEPPAITEFNRDVQPQLSQAVQACLAAAPSARPQTATELLSNLQGHFSQQQRVRVRRWAVSATLALVACSALFLAIAAAVRPGGHQRTYRLALSRLLAGDLTAAEENLKSILDAEPNAAATRLALSLVHLEQREYEHAEGELREILHTRSPLVLECLAHTKVASGDVKNVAVHVGAAAREESDLKRRSRLLLWEAAALRRYGPQDPKEIWLTAEKALAADPESSRAHWFHANLYLSLNFAKLTAAREAITRIETAIRLGEPHELVYYFAALIYIKAEQDLSKDYSQRIEELLTLAIKNGVRHVLMRKNPRFKSYADQPWYRALLAQYPEKQRDPKETLFRQAIDVEQLARQLRGMPFDSVP